MLKMCPSFATVDVHYLSPGAIMKILERFEIMDASLSAY
jgi:hypothetical protein